MEALDFLLTNPNKYLIALLVGVVLNLLPWLLGISVILAMMSAFFWDEEKKIPLYIIDGVLTVIMAIINENMVHYVGALILVCVCACFVIYAFVQDSK